MRDADQSAVEKSESTSSSLLARVRSEDDEAWRRLVSLYGPMVHDWCRYAQLQSEDLADVFQDIFIAVHRGMAEFRKDRPGDTFRGWLRTIARNKLQDHYRRRAAEPAGAGGSWAAQQMRELPIEEDELDCYLAKTEDQHLFQRAAELVKAEFEPATWQAFWKVAVEGQSTKEAAADLGMSVIAIRQAKSRVLRRLREEFSGLLDLADPDAENDDAIG